jgi:hypothetical protein
MLVSQIDDLIRHTQTVGGWDPTQLVGQNVVIWAKSGPLNGVISRKAIHLQDENEKKQLIKASDLWIDCGVIEAAELKALVQIGDSVTLRLGYQKLCGDVISGPAMDDRYVWVVMEVMRAPEANACCTRVDRPKKCCGLQDCRRRCKSNRGRRHARDGLSDDDRRQIGDIYLSAAPSFSMVPISTARRI